MTVGRLLEVIDCRQPPRRDLRAQAGTATLLPIGMRSLPGTTGVRDPWNHNLEYQHWLLDQVPVHCEHALDVGCGDGWLARRLAERVTWVTGIDLSAPMIERARQAAAELPNLTFKVGNLLDQPLPEAGFDFISAVAVLHHLPFEPALTAGERRRHFYQPYPAGPPGLVGIGCPAG